MGDKITAAYSTEYGKLCRIALAYLPNPSLKGLAEELGISYASLRDRMSGRSELKREMVYAIKAIPALGLLPGAQESHPQLQRGEVLRLLRENVGLEHSFNHAMVWSLAGNHHSSGAIARHIERLDADGLIAKTNIHGRFRLVAEIPDAKRVCRFPNCDRPHHARGLCLIHYMKQKRSMPT